MEGSAMPPMNGAERVTADSGALLIGTPTLHLTDTGSPLTEEGLDHTVLQAVGQYNHVNLCIILYYDEREELICPLMTFI